MYRNKNKSTQDPKSIFKVHVLYVFQGSQEKGLSQASGSAEAVGVVSRPGAGDISAVEGGHWTAW